MKLMFLSRKGNRRVSLARTWRNSQIVTNFTASTLTFWRCHVSLYHYSADRNAHETSFRGSYFITLLCVTNSVGQGWRTNGTRHSLLSQFCFISFARPVSVYVYIYTYLTPKILCINYRCYQIILRVKHLYTNLDDWFTVHHSITLVDLQLDAQNSCLFIYNTFIKILYMFRALPCSSSGGLRCNCIYAASGIVTLCG